MIVVRCDGLMVQTLKSINSRTSQQIIWTLGGAKIRIKIKRKGRKEGYQTLLLGSPYDLSYTSSILQKISFLKALT